MKDEITDEFCWGWKDSVLVIVGLLLILIVGVFVYTRFI